MLQNRKLIYEYNKANLQIGVQIEKGDVMTNE